MSDRRPVIVVGYDGSAAARAAVDVAIERAGPTGHLIVVHACDVPPEYVGTYSYQDRLDNRLREANEVMDPLKRTCEYLSAADWEPGVAVGSPGELICRVARRRSADEIVIGTRGRGRVAALLGSVACDVLHRASCPVLVIQDRMVHGDEANAPAAGGMSSATGARTGV